MGRVNFLTNSKSAHTPYSKYSNVCTLHTGLDKFRCTTAQPSAFWMKASTLPTVCATFIVITIMICITDIILMIVIVIIIVIIAMIVIVLQLQHTLFLG